MKITNQSNKNAIKAQIMMANYTMAEVVDALSMEYGWSDSQSNFSAKTPHMHFCFLPMTPDNRLSAKEIVGNKKKLTQWQDDFWSYMVKFYPDLGRGESASKTGRTHIPPRLFKEAVHLNQQKDMLLELLSDINPPNAKKRSVEIKAILEKYIPGTEKMHTRLKKYDAAYKELKTEIAALEKEVDASKESVARRLELLQQVQELEKLRKLVDTIPAEILAVYSESKSERKERCVAYE